MSRARGALVAIVIACVVFVLYRRDRAQQAQIDETLRVLAKVEATRPSAPPVVIRERAVDDVAVVRPTAAPTRSEPVSAPSPSPEQETGAHEAHAALDHALSSRRLSRDDVQRMRAQPLSAQQRDELRSQIAVAINKGELTPDDPHFIYP
jgi:hypothetical protein